MCVAVYVVKKASPSGSNFSFLEDSGKFAEYLFQSWSSDGFTVLLRVSVEPRQWLEGINLPNKHIHATV
jgi:hypothetical protein